MERSVTVRLLAERRREAAEPTDLPGVGGGLGEHEVVDATGHAWRIDPMTGSFVRRAPGRTALWRPADPSEFASTPAGEEADHGFWRVTARRIAGPPDRRQEYRTLVAAGTLLVLALVSVFSLVVPPGGQVPGPPQAVAAPVMASTPVPSTSRASTVLAEVVSGDPRRVDAVAERSQFGDRERRLHAATYAGWIRMGLTVDQRPSAGTPSGAGALQTWELRDRSAVVAVAQVRWRRADAAAPWRITEWPVFQPVT
jgi:hypothetical protein